MPGVRVVALMPAVRAERLVCSGRLFLALTALVATVLDAPDSATNRMRTIPLLIGYALYAAFMELLISRPSTRTLLARYGSHVVDVAVILLLNYLGDAATSPFFVFFVFALVSASIRFGARVSMITAGVVIVGYLLLGLHETVIESMSRSDRTRFLIRTSYLGVIAILIHHLTSHHDRLRGELMNVAAWPRERARSLEAALADILPRAAALLRADRLLLIWETNDEPWVYAAYLRSGKVTLAQHPPGEYLPVVDSAIARSTFVSRTVGGRRTTVQDPLRPMSVSNACPIHPKVVQTYDIGPVVSAAFDGELARGRVFFLDPHHLTADEATVAEIVAALVVTTLEQQLVVNQLQVAASAEARLRVARDLHDGVVQSLAGVALHLHMLERLMEEDPEQARASLREISRTVLDDQRELRSYIAELRPAQETTSQERSLSARIQAAAARIERERSIRMEVVFDPHLDAISPGMQTEAYHVVREAMSNAAKHAQATKISVAVGLRGDRVVASIVDDGEGFPFHGRFDLEALEELRRGPLTLKERVRALAGNLILDTGPNGSSLQIVLPRSLAEVRNADSSAAGR